MKTLKFSILTLSAMPLSCMQHNQQNAQQESSNNSITEQQVHKEPHRFGGWYCPDNLYGFPAVDINRWNTVPVIHNRMATLEEVKSESSLIFVDPEKHPTAHVLPITMPKLGYFNCQCTKRKELIIAIQAFEIDKDSIVGFRYLNGGNGSAHLSEIDFLSFAETQALPSARFVNLSIEIKAEENKVWQVLNDPQFLEKIQHVFDPLNELDSNWRKSSNVNFHYKNAGNLTNPYGDRLFGNFYIQNDYDQMNYTEKFLIMGNRTKGTTTLEIVCGPFIDDFEEQSFILKQWAQKIKSISEKLKSC